MKIKHPFSSALTTGNILILRLFLKIFGKLLAMLLYVFSHFTFMQDSLQIVDRYEIKEDYFVYDSAIINLTEKQLIDRIAKLQEKYSDVYLIRMDENMHPESEKNNKLKLHQFCSGHDELNLAGFQHDFILYLQNKHLPIFYATLLSLMNLNLYFRE
ncbi:hypothetical protein SH601_04945 [Gracilibacillus sp. S3-1-1]|uniref:Uncharacterized protein n=1 Tax=Gracilibacillus pellucidus TaxID=3095368 RepID=A0ACC6M2Z0_9BACI|nr:hypothetical protein [Gracilibacillus sp. S3-1-1]MDX8045330.1 hypothetical protein [Gracilibacillus sp. S3-1-1]